jgi:ABC-2 type transport system permease protein
MITVLPFILSITFFTDANGTIPLILSLFPLTAPLAVIMRMPLATVPVWQIILSMVLLALSTVLVMWLAARVFRLGMLMYGKNLSLREIVRAMREGRQTMTSVAHAQEQEA